MPASAASNVIVVAPLGIGTVVVVQAPLRLVAAPSCWKTCVPLTRTRK